MALDLPASLPGRASPRNPLSGLRYAVLILLVLLTGAVAYLIADRSRGEGGPPLTSLETGEGVAQRSLNLDLKRTRRGLPSLQITAREALTYRAGGTVLHDVSVTVFDEGQERTEISAPLAVSGEASAGGWSFREGVVLKNERGLHVEVPEITYRESPPELNATGEVVFSTGSVEGRARGLRYLVARRRLEFLSDVSISAADSSGAQRTILATSARLDPRSDLVTFMGYVMQSSTGQTLSGSLVEVGLEAEGSNKRVRSLRALRGFRAFFPADPAGGAPVSAEGHTLTGDRLELQLDPEGLPVAVFAEGGVRLADGNPEEHPRSLSSDRLDAEFREGRIVKVTASQSAQLQIPAARDPRGESATVDAGRITAGIDQAGRSFEAIEAEGDVKVSHGTRTLESPKLRYEPSQERWILSGSAESPASLTTEGATIAANEIEIDRTQEILLARGRVKTTTSSPASPATPGAGTPAAGTTVPGAGARGLEGLFGSEGGALHAMSERLRLQMKERQARYTGGVRIWKGSGSIEALEVRFSEAEGLLDAEGGVVARIPVEGASDPSTRTVTITSSSLRYRRDAMDARFGGGTVATTGGLRIQAESMHATGTTLEGLRQLEADGGVTLRQGRILGEGDRLVADFPSERFSLIGKGRLATMQDQSNQQVARGAVLTYERSTGRIQVESESGGRTWITLRPTSEEGERGDPKPPR